MVQLFGPEDGGHLLHLTGKLIGMQYFDEIARGLGLGHGTAKDFAAFLGALFEAQDDVADVNESAGAFEFRQQTWKLMADVTDYHPACASVLEGLFAGLAAGCRRHIAVSMTPAAGGKPPFLWSIGWPNVMALSAGTCVVIAEPSYIGRLGVESLAAMALVFPFVILTMTMSGGAMGGGVASAVARALGAGDVDRASALAAHALLIGICFGLTFMIGMLIFGPGLLELLGGRGSVLANAVDYSQIFFGGAVLPWLMNSMAGILRGTGNMKLPSLMILNSAVCQIILGGTLGLRLRPIPQFGMRGVAAGSLIAYLISIAIMGWDLFSGRARVIPRTRGLHIQWAMFVDTLKAGAVSCSSPLQSVLSISIFTHMLAGFGTQILAGYGI